MSMSNTWRLWRARSQARQDAEAGIEADLDRLVTALLGAKPRGAGTFEDALLGEQQGRGEAFEAMNDDIEALDGALATHAPRIAYFVVAIVSFVAEVGASSAALHVMGYEGVERWLLAFSLGLGTLLIAGATTRVEAVARRSIARWMIRGGTALAYLVVVGAAAWVRATQGEEALSLMDIAASAVLLAVATGAPAIASHWSFARLHVAGDLHKRRKTLRQAQRKAVRSRGRARDTRVKSERDSAEWETQSARIRATYLVELRRAQANIARTKKDPAKA